jgi:hypothetical protein
LSFISSRKFNNPEIALVPIVEKRGSYPHPYKPPQETPVNINSQKKIEKREGKNFHPLPQTHLRHSIRQHKHLSMDNFTSYIHI